MKKTWELINEATKKKRKNKENVQRLNLENTLILDSTEIAENFNKFFVKIASEIEKKIPPADVINETAHTDPLTFFKCDPIISQDILDVLTQLQPKHSLDPTNIPIFLLKKFGPPDLYASETHYYFVTPIW